MGFGKSQNSQSFLRSARRVRTSGPFMCVICNCGFKSNSSLKQHVSKVHGAALPQRFKCHHCEFETDWKGNLRNHMRLHAADFPGVGRKKRPCGLCDRSFSNNTNLLNHRRSHKPIHFSQDPADPPLYECDFCGLRLVRKGEFSQHRKFHVSKNRMACLVCHKWFRYKDKLEIHLGAMHLKDRPFSCLICEKSYKTKSILQKHGKVHGKQEVCYICGAVEKSSLSLEKHIARHDTVFNMFCMICNKGFGTIQALNVHTTQEHAGEAPFKCLICGAAFRSKTYLKLHEKTHQEPVKFKCSLCNFESTWKKSLRNHTKIHSGENLMTCEVCGKCLSTKTSFETHMRIHTGEKPHICEVCGKAFSAKKYLHLHNRTHTGEKPYVCEKCPKRFTQKGSMKLHMKSQHVFR